MRGWIVIAVVLAVGAAVLTVRPWGGHDGAPGSNETATDLEARFAAFRAAPEPNGDLSKVVWPDYVLQAGGDVQELYAFQVTNGPLMRYIPCFCGCGGDGHRSNRDCYVKSVGADGSVVFDSMAPT